MTTISTSCGSEVSGRHVPAVRNVGGAVRKRVHTHSRLSAARPWICAKVRATRRTIIDCAAASPLAVSSVSTTGLAAGKDRHFTTTICTRRPPCAATGKQGNLFTEKYQKGEP